MWCPLCGNGSVVPVFKKTGRRRSCHQSSPYLLHRAASNSISTSAREDSDGVHRSALTLVAFVDFQEVFDTAWVEATLVCIHEVGGDRADVASHVPSSLVTLNLKFELVHLFQLHGQTDTLASFGTWRCPIIVSPTSCTLTTSPVVALRARFAGVLRRCGSVGQEVALQIWRGDPPYLKPWCLGPPDLCPSVQ